MILNGFTSPKLFKIVAICNEWLSVYLMQGHVTIINCSHLESRGDVYDCKSN